MLAKKIFLLLAIVTTVLVMPSNIHAQGASACTGEPIEVTLSPNPVQAGQTVTVTAQSTFGNRTYIVAFDFEKLPTTEDPTASLTQEINIGADGRGTATVNIPANFVNGPHIVLLVTSMRGSAEVCSRSTSVTVTGGSTCKNVTESCTASDVLCDPIGTYCNSSTGKVSQKESCLGLNDGCTEFTDPSKLCEPNTMFCKYPPGIVLARGGSNSPCLKQPDGSRSCNVGTPTSQTDSCSCNTQDATSYSFCTRNGVSGIDTAIGCILFTDNSGGSPIVAISSFFLKWAVGIVGGIGLILFIFAGLMIITSTGDPERLKSGRDLLVASLSGILLIIFSVFILRFIGINIIGI